MFPTCNPPSPRYAQVGTASFVPTQLSGVGLKDPDRLDRPKELNPKGLQSLGIPHIVHGQPHIYALSGLAVHQGVSSNLALQHKAEHEPNKGLALNSEMVEHA